MRKTGKGIDLEENIEVLKCRCQVDSWLGGSGAQTSQNDMRTVPVENRYSETKGFNLSVLFPTLNFMQ